MPRCYLGEGSGHAMVAGREVRKAKEVVRLVEGKLRYYIGCKGLASVREIDGFARLLCIYETRAEYANNLFDLGLKLLDFRDGEVRILRAAPNAVEFVVYCSKRCVAASKCSVVPVPFANSGANLERLCPVWVIDVDFVWSNTNDWA
jgi:hypothetical protein